MVELIFIITFFCLGVKLITSERDMIFKGFGKFRKRLPSFLSYPLGECPACMASIYGTILYWVMILHTYKKECLTDVLNSLRWDVFAWIVVVICSAFLNNLLWYLYKILKYEYKHRYKDGKDNQ